MLKASASKRRFVSDEYLHRSDGSRECTAMCGGTVREAQRTGEPRQIVSSKGQGWDVLMRACWLPV